MEWAYLLELLDLILLLMLPACCLSIQLGRHLPLPPDALCQLCIALLLQSQCLLQCRNLLNCSNSTVGCHD